MTMDEIKVEELMARPWTRVFRLEKLSNGETYFACVPELPECFTQAPTIEEAQDNLQDVLYWVLLDHVERGKEIPSPALQPIRSLRRCDFEPDARRCEPTLTPTPFASSERELDYELCPA